MRRGPITLRIATLKVTNVSIIIINLVLPIYVWFTTEIILLILPQLGRIKVETEIKKSQVTNVQYRTRRFDFASDLSLLKADAL